MDLLELQKEERIVPFLRRSSLDWDFVRGQLIELDSDDKIFLKCWCQRILQLLEGSLLGLDLEDRLLRLESDNDSLHIQNTHLSDQVHVQNSKIQDLERILVDKKNGLECTQDKLSKELLHRSALETQKLELMTEISSLRLKQAALECENFDLKDRCGLGGTDYEIRLWSKPPIVPHLRSPSPTQHHQTQQNGYLENGHRSRLVSDAMSPPVKHISRPRTPPANAYRRIEQNSFGTLPRRNQTSQLSAFNNGMSIGDDGTPTSPLSPTSISSGNLHSVSPFQNNQTNHGSFLPLTQPRSSFQFKPFRVEPSAVRGFRGESPSASGFGGGRGRDLCLKTEKGPRSTSAPNLAGIERDDWGRRKNSWNGKSKSPGNGNGVHKSRGILRILSKLRRSNSGGLDDDVAPVESNQFVRGGFRATAAPRLGWTSKSTTVIRKPERPIHLWDCDAVLLWFSYLGLDMYAQDVKRFIKSGQQLLDASNKDLEKELGLKNPLHRKKLMLGIQSLRNPNEGDDCGKLDSDWVIRWLDDIGLPQYKESFAEARVDGRVLSRLTTQDLIFLKVTNLLHHMSIKRGIQLLRIHKFSPGCLCRRSSAIVTLSRGSDSPSPEHVATWSNHRVMEWLRAVELSEYAPNLRGSGVHGALIILEPKFNADFLATMLSIPGDKTLLRRHVNQEVNDLLGREIVQEKRKVEMSPDFLPLSPTLKVKVKNGKPMKVFHLRRKRNSLENEELLCPLDMNHFPVSCSNSSQDVGGGDGYESLRMPNDEKSSNI